MQDQRAPRHPVHRLVEQGCGERGATVERAAPPPPAHPRCEAPLLSDLEYQQGRVHGIGRSVCATNVEPRAAVRSRAPVADSVTTAKHLGVLLGLGSRPAPCEDGPAGVPTLAGDLLSRPGPPGANGCMPLALAQFGGLIVRMAGANPGADRALVFTGGHGAPLPRVSTAPKAQML